MLNNPQGRWPHYSGDEIAAVAAVMESGRVNYWTGERCVAFEQAFADRMGSTYGIALMNGTVALDLALKALGIGAGDEVIVTPRSFIASVSCVINAGAIPVFADVDLDSGNLSAATIAPVLTERTRAILPVHLAGWPCDMTGIMDLAKAHGLAVIEDCAQAHGATHQGRSVGAFGDVGAWSFCQDKIMTTGGEGGMVTTDSQELRDRMWSYKDHGKNEAAAREGSALPKFRPVHDSFGTNWRMLEVQAAIGLLQLGYLADWLDTRARNAALLRQHFARHDGVIRLPEPEAGDVHAYYRLYGYVRPEGLASGWSRDRILAELMDLKLGVSGGSCPEIYLEKAFEGTGFAPPQRLPNAMALGETSLAFLTHPTLTEADIARVGEEVGKVLARACR